MKQVLVSVFLEVESLLLQVERLTLALIAGFKDAQGNSDSGLTPALLQQNLLRGQLLLNAQERLENKGESCSESEKKVLFEKWQQLQGFDAQLGQLIQAHHQQIRQELKALRHAHKQLHAYTEHD